MRSSINRSPWAWVPSLYFAEGIPYVAVMTISLIMYKRLGLSNTDITLYTSWLYLPWVIKPLWSPFVDMMRSKRWWIITMQLLIGAALNAVYMNSQAVGNVMATDVTMAGYTATALAMAGGSDTAMALALSIPIGIFGALLFTAQNAVCVFVSQLCNS